MASKNKNRLIAYVQTTQAKLEKTDEIDNDVVVRVVNSIKSLSAGAPGEMRTQLKDALQSADCIDNAEAGIEQLKAGLAAVADVMGIEDEEEEPTQEVNVEPGDEAATLVGVVNRLWELEEPYRLKVGEDVVLNAQHKADYDPVNDDGSVDDRATEPLFASLDKSKLTAADHAFIALLDNYKREADKAETVTSEERQEMSKFLDLIDDTPHMRYVHKVLVKWDMAPAKYRTFMSNVHDAWFTNYYRGKSSGFEHVFVGEEKVNRNSGKSEIIGLHNWLQFAREEARGNMNYLGYAHKGPADGQLVTVKFAWVDDDPEVEVKPMSTFLVGSSIAFEFALGCLIFFGGKDGDKPWVKIGDHDVAIQLYKVQDRMGEYVRTVYME